MVTISIPVVCSQWNLLCRVVCSDASKEEIGKCQSLGDMLECMRSHGHDKTFPEIFKLYRLMRMPGLTTVKNERALSKLKLIETHLRTNMAEER